MIALALAAEPLKSVKCRLSFIMPIRPMSEVAAKRPVEHLERAGCVVMKKPAIVGAAALGRGFEG